MRDAFHFRVIQRRRGGGHGNTVENDGDVVETESLGAAVFSGSTVEVLCWAEEPVETDDAKVDDMGIEAAEDRMVDLEGCEEVLEDGEVGWVGPGGRAVFIFEALEESNE